MAGPQTSGWGGPRGPRGPAPARCWEKPQPAGSRSKPFRPAGAARAAGHQQVAGKTSNLLGAVQSLTVRLSRLGSPLELQLSAELHKTSQDQREGRLPVSVRVALRQDGVVVERVVEVHVPRD